MCVHDHSYACVCTQGLGTCTQQRVSTTFLTEKLSQIVLVLLIQAGFNLGSLDLKSDALPTEPPRHI